MDVKIGGRFLKEQRERRGLTQVRVSLIAGLDETGRQRLPFEIVTRLERGFFQDPKFSQLCEYGKVLCIDPVQIAIAYGLWPESNEPVASNGKLKAALNAAHELPDDLQDYNVQTIYRTIEASREQ